jgi:threonyl-tRNA synthetase
MHMSDSLGRSWQISTIQLDFQMPARFGLTYQGDDVRDLVELRVADPSTQRLLALVDRGAELYKIPYVVVWGERESLDALALRRRGGEQVTVSWESLLSELQSAAKV